MGIHISISAKRALASGLASLALVAGIASGIGASALAQRSPAVASAATIVKGGAVKMAALPHVTSTTKVSAISVGKAAHTQQTAGNGAVLLDPALQSPAQVAALAAYDQAHPGALPQAVSAPAPQAGNMYGAGALPVKQNAVAGPNSTLDDINPPNLTVATAGAYTEVGTNQTYSIYDNTLSPLTLEDSPEFYFTAWGLYRGGDLFEYPQFTYDAERSFFVNMWEELNPSTGHTYFDLWTTNSAAYFEGYAQIDPATVFSGDYCTNPALGYDYWGIYITCDLWSISGGSFQGNGTIALGVDRMTAGAPGSPIGYTVSVTRASGTGGQALTPTSAVPSRHTVSARRSRMAWRRLSGWSLRTPAGSGRQRLRTSPPARSPTR
jgi:hypothetical protein